MNQRLSVTPAKATADNDLTDSEYRTLAVIGIFSNPEGWCWPSQSTLADLRGVSRKTINLHIKRLIELGYLNIHARYDEETGAQKSNMMQIKLDFPPNVTGGVTPKTLQGGSHPRSYTPRNIQDVTHNDLMNDPKERIYTPPVTGNGKTIHQQEYFPPEIQALITAIAAISKTPYWPKTEQEYSDAAYFLAGNDATPADVSRFAEWWALNGFYAGKPALKTILDNWTGFTSGLTASSANGSARPEVIEFAVFDED